MNKRATGVFLAAVMIFGAGTAFAAGKWPPGAGTCVGESLKVVRIQREGDGCDPARRDTVLGVAGVITAFDNVGSTRGFYIQNNATDQRWTGILNFTGGAQFSASPNFWVLGDSVVVYGTTNEFNGLFFDGSTPSAWVNAETELEGPDTLSNTADFIGRKVSGVNAAHPIPPFKILTRTDLHWVSSISAATAEPWEGTLVKVRGPMKVVARAQGSGGPCAFQGYPGIETRNPCGGGYLLTSSPTADADTIYVDSSNLFVNQPPPVNTVVDSVQGVLFQRQTSGTGVNSGVNSYRIQLRDGDDQALATPPNVRFAFSVATNQVRVQFDRDVTAGSAGNSANYTFPNSLRSVSGVATVGSDYAVINVGTGGVGNVDSISVNGITGQVNGQTMTIGQKKGFVFGILSIATVQAANKDSLNPAHPNPLCSDRSKYAGVNFSLGPLLTTRGVCTGIFILGSDRAYYIQDEAGGVRSGIGILSPNPPLVVGHKYLIAAEVEEFFEETRLGANAAYILDEGNGTTPALYSASVAELGSFVCDSLQGLTNGEDREGCLVEINTRVKVLDEPPPGRFDFHVEPYPAGGAQMVVDVTSAQGYVPSVDDVINVKGVLRYQFGEGEVNPRNNSDVVFKGTLDVGLIPGEVTFSAYPNPGNKARFSFGVPRRDRVELSVFDVQGRKLVTLARGTMEPGNYSREWDGRIEGGGKTGAGVYFYRLKVGGETYTLRGVRMD